MGRRFAPPQESLDVFPQTVTSRNGAPIRTTSTEISREPDEVIGTLAHAVSRKSVQ